MKKRELDIYPDKSAYSPGEKVRILAELPACFKGRITFRIWHLARVLHTEAYELAGNEETVVWEFLPGQDGCGYGVEAEFRDGKEIYTKATAFDLRCNDNLSVRYGFLCDFDTGDGEDDTDVDFLRKLHINLAQFYDWSYRHERFVSDEDVYTDMMGCRVDSAVLRSKISRCKERGIKPIGYAPVYAASKDFYETHRDWGLYTSDGNPYVFIDTFYIMDVSKRSPWTVYIEGQYIDVVNRAGFEGIHMDAYGFPKAAFSCGNGEKTLVRLEEHFPCLIEGTRKRFREKGAEDAVLIFNNVGNWPVRETAKSADIVYIEVWPPYERYHHIKEIIQGARREGGKKPVILAAYLKPFRDEPEEMALQALLLMTAAYRRVLQGPYPPRGRDPGTRKMLLQLYSTLPGHTLRLRASGCLHDAYRMGQLGIQLRSGMERMGGAG